MMTRILRHMLTHVKRRKRLQIADVKAKFNQVSQLVELIEIELVIATDTITNSTWEWNTRIPFGCPT
jgi:hypothetical protein